MPSNTVRDDELVLLIDRTALQDEVAFKALYDASAARLYGLAIRVVRNREWAQDVLQEAFLQIWRSAGNFRGELSPPLAWMGLIVRSRGLDFLRRRQAERSDSGEPLDDDHEHMLPSDTPGPDADAQASELARALHNCLERLDNPQREVVSLAYLRDLSHNELAAQLRLPLGTVKTWIRRGLDQLRHCMARFA